MEMLPLPNGGGVSALLEWHRQVFPEGHELVGIEDSSGHLYTVEDLKALEGQESKMELKIQRNVPDEIRDILGSPSKRRSVEKAFFYNDTYIAFANDGTAWILVRDTAMNGMDYWKQLQNAGVPDLPQAGAF